jgi:hypothetical protein
VMAWMGGLDFARLRARTRGSLDAATDPIGAVPREFLPMDRR